MDESKSIKQLNLNDMQLIEFNRNDKKKLLVEKMVARDKRPVYRICKPFEENGNQGLNICRRNSGLVILVDALIGTTNRPKIIPFNPSVGRRTTLSLCHICTVHLEKKSRHCHRVHHPLALSPLHFYV